MRYRQWIFGAVCLLAIVYVAYANMRGYVPFVTNTVNAAHGAPAHFHK